MTPHPHAENMRLYAEDAAETNRPWERWEYQSEGVWHTHATNPSWMPHVQYRRKTKTIRIGEFDVPEPARTPLQTGQRFWVPSNSSLDHVRTGLWDGFKFDTTHLARGLVHLTREAAEIHAKALLSFTSPTP